MKRIQSLVAGLLLAATAAVAGPDPQQILAASDAIRNPGRPFAVTVTLIGPGVDTSHGYERTHEDALLDTAQLVAEYLVEE